MALDLVCGVCYVNKSGKRVLFKHLKVRACRGISQDITQLLLSSRPDKPEKIIRKQDKHDVDVNEANPHLELLVEKKMWEIDMESVSEPSMSSTINRRLFVPLLIDSRDKTLFS